jgi:hypothetical protein
VTSQEQVSSICTRLSSALVRVTGAGTSSTKDKEQVAVYWIRNTIGVQSGNKIGLMISLRIRPGQRTVTMLVQTRIGTRTIRTLKWYLTMVGDSQVRRRTRLMSFEELATRVVNLVYLTSDDLRDRSDT